MIKKKSICATSSYFLFPPSTPVVTDLYAFSLQGVSAGTSGAVALAAALMTNQTLQTLE